MSVKIEATVMKLSDVELAKMVWELGGKLIDIKAMRKVVAVTSAKTACKDIFYIDVNYYISHLDDWMIVSNAPTSSIPIADQIKDIQQSPCSIQ